MIRPDLVEAVNAGWKYVENTDSPSRPECVHVICDEAAARYTRIERQRAFAKAAMAAVIHQN